MLPNFVQKYTKKWGAKVGEVELPDLEESARKMWSVDVTPEMKRDVMEGQPMFSLAYHGSGADFDRFDHSHMGEGEGAQAYGWGTYVTEVEGIGRTYAKSNGTKRPATYRGMSPMAITHLSKDFWHTIGVETETQRDALTDILRSLDYGYRDPVRMIRVKRESLQEKITRQEKALARQQVDLTSADGEEKEKLQKSINRRQKTIEDLQNTLDFVNGLDANDFVATGGERVLYTVEIPDDVDEADEVNARYNEQLEKAVDGTLRSNVELGAPSGVLQACGLNGTGIFIKPSTLREHMDAHGLTVADLRNLPSALRKPLLVYEWGTKAKSLIVVTEIQTADGRKITAAVKLERNGARVEVNEIASVHGKEAERLLSEFVSEMENPKHGGLENTIKYVGDKEKVLDWLGFTPPKGAADQPTKDLSLAKVIQDFENPKVSEKKVGEYLSWEKPLTDEQMGVIGSMIDGEHIDEFRKHYKGGNGRSNATGERVYSYLSDILGSDKAASEALSNHFTGIKYPAQYTTGGREDNAKNYVIFDENDVEIKDKQKFSLARQMDAEYMDAVEKGDMDTAQDMVDKAAEAAGYTIRGFHGTTHLFNIFDRSKGNAEGNWGKGFYFTNNKDDVESNYANPDGADLTNRIELLAEQLEWQDGYEDMDYEERKEEARKLLDGGETRIITAALRINNPVVIGSHADMPETFFDFDSGYNPETDEYDGEESGLLADFADAWNMEMSSGRWYPDNISPFELFDGSDGYTAEQLEKASREILDKGGIENENGEQATGEFLRSVFERMGFDGIVDSNVNFKFGTQRKYGQSMAGVDEGTIHFIAFHPEQIKQTDAVTYDDNGEVIPLSQRFDVTNDDIRFSLPGEREVQNVIVDSSKEKLPDNRTDAIKKVSGMKRPFINIDQNKEIEVSNNAVRHSATQDHSGVDVQCMGVIDKIVREAVKVGEIPVNVNEEGHTHKVEVYYCPVNIDGVQYSARLIVKQYENGGDVLDAFQLYDLHSRQEKTGAETRGTGSSTLLQTQQTPVSAYKVKDLIHSTQENDLELLGVNKQEAKFSLAGSRNHYNNGGDVIDDDKVLARAMYEQRLRSRLYQITEALQDSMLSCSHLQRGWLTVTPIGKVKALLKNETVPRKAETASQTFEVRPLTIKLQFKRRAVCRFFLILQSETNQNENFRR